MAVYRADILKRVSNLEHGVTGVDSFGLAVFAKIKVGAASTLVTNSLDTGGLRSFLSGFLEFNGPRSGDLLDGNVFDVLLNNCPAGVIVAFLVASPSRATDLSRSLLRAVHGVRDDLVLVASVASVGHLLLFTVVAGSARIFGHKVHILMAAGQALPLADNFTRRVAAVADSVVLGGLLGDHLLESLSGDLLDLASDHLKVVNHLFEFRVFFVSLKVTRILVLNRFRGKFLTRDAGVDHSLRLGLNGLFDLLLLFEVRTDSAGGEEAGLVQALMHALDLISVLA